MADLPADPAADPSASPGTPVLIASARISARAMSRVGFDPISIVAILLPLLASCFKQQATGETPKDYLADHYDEMTGHFDRQLVERCRPQARRAARKDGQRKLTRDQLDAITDESLREAMRADDSAVASVLESVE